MFLIIDTNVLFSFFRKSKVLELVRKLRSSGYKLITPDFMYSELLKLEGQILKYSGISTEEFDILLIGLKQVVKSIPKSEYSDFLQEANQISPDKKDAPLFALALSVQGSIWSREPKLKRQKTIRLLSDEDIIKML